MLKVIIREMQVKLTILNWPKLERSWKMLRAVREAGMQEAPWGRRLVEPF